MRNPAISRTTVASTLVFVGALLVYAWTPVPVKEDRNVFMPGSQPGTIAPDSAAM